MDDDYWDDRRDYLVHPRLGHSLPVDSDHIVRFVTDVAVISVVGDLAWGGVRHG